MSAPFFIPGSFGDHHAMTGDIPPLPANSGSDQFKIVHGWFRSREAVESAIVEHSEFGWELHEVLDGFRIRFRRTAQAAAKDVARVGNPYAMTCRRQYNGPALLMILGVPAVIAATLFLLFVVKSSTVPRTAPKLVRTQEVANVGSNSRVVVVETPSVISVPAPPASPVATKVRP